MVQPSSIEDVNVSGSLEEKKTGDAAAFAAFWAAYPRRDDKPAALRAFVKALTRTNDNPAPIVAGARRYRDDPNRDPGFTKLPATWLNNDCWENGPLPSRLTASTNGRRGDGVSAVLDKLEGMVP